MSVGWTVGKFPLRLLFNMGNADSLYFFPSSLPLGADSAEHGIRLLDSGLGLWGSLVFSWKC